MRIELVRDVLQEAYGLRVFTAQPLVGGADPAAHTFRADTWTGPVVVKVSSVPAAAAAVALAEHLRALGRSEILMPTSTRLGESYVVIEDSALVVWPFRAGRSGFEEHHSPAVLARVGACVRAVHDLPVTVGLPVPTDRLADGMRAETRRWLARDLSAGDAVQQRLGRLLDRSGDRLMGLVEAAERLADELEAGPAVLCHGDLHAGNVLVQPDGSLTIIDWDTAVLARRERDLMFPGAGIMSTWSAPQQVAAFFAGYGPYEVAESQSAAIAYFRCDRICADVVAYARAVVDPVNADRLTAVIRLESQFQPGDVVDQAERSLRQLP